MAVYITQSSYHISTKIMNIHWMSSKSAKQRMPKRWQHYRSSLLSTLSDEYYNFFFKCLLHVNNYTFLKNMFSLYSNICLSIKVKMQILPNPSEEITITDYLNLSLLQKGKLMVSYIKQGHVFQSIIKICKCETLKKVAAPGLENRD